MAAEKEQVNGGSVATALAAASEWRIPASRMKMGELHIVPLPTQVVALLRRLHEFTGSSRYLFPGLRRADRPISENTIGL